MWDPSTELCDLICRGDFNIYLFACCYRRRQEDPGTELGQERLWGGSVVSW